MNLFALITIYKFIHWQINKIFAETFGTDVYDEDLGQCTKIAKKY